MSTHYAVIYLNGHRYRVQGLSHDDSGSRIHYDSLEAMENAFRSRLENCERVEEPPAGATACWLCAQGKDHYRIEAHEDAAVRSS